MAKSEIPNQSKPNFLPKPYPTEVQRIRLEELTDQVAKNFAYDLNSLTGNNPNNNFKAETFQPVQIKEYKNGQGTPWFVRYTINPDSPDLGLILTEISESRIEVDENGFPVIYQMGKDIRTIALAQRTEYFLANQNPEIHDLITGYENDSKQISPRPIRQHKAVEEALKIKRDFLSKFILSLGKKVPSFLHNAAIKNFQALSTIALEELGYKKRSSEKNVSRSNVDLFNNIGKYPRRVIMGGSMPPSFGGADALTTMIVGHMCAFIPRNSLFVDIDRQVALAKAVQEKINQIDISQQWKQRALRNLGASLGIDNPHASLESAKKLYDAGIRLFRIYTIGADPRIVETARLLRQEYGDEIEIFIGQIPDKELGLKLIAPDIRVDALIFGHGGGRQCTSAENGMAVTTLEEKYQFTTDPRFQKTSILVEGGVGRNIGTMLILGVDGVLFNGRIMHGTIESPAGDIYLKEIRTGKYVQPYPGSASAETQLIESAVIESLRSKRMNAAGRIKSEGAPGFTIFERKAGGSMAFWIQSLLADTARMMTDLGVKNLSELRQLMANPKIDVLRLVSANAKVTGSAYRNTK